MMENEINIIGNRIKQMRLENSWTQKDLAIKLGLKNDTAIANYETGYSTPKDEVKFKMCELFNCSLDYLMGKSDIRNNEEKEQDILDLAKVGFTKENYNPPTEKQKEQIRAIIKTILEDNKKEK